MISLLGRGRVDAGAGAVRRQSRGRETTSPYGNVSAGHRVAIVGLRGESIGCSVCATECSRCVACGARGWEGRGCLAAASRGFGDSRGGQWGGDGVLGEGLACSGREAGKRRG